MTDKDSRQPDEEGQGYSKVARRAGHEPPEAQEEAAQEAPEAAEEPVPDLPAETEETGEVEQAGEVPPPDQEPPPPETLADVGAFGVLRFCASLLVQQSWVSLGLIATPGGEARENLPEARVAIDALASVLEHLRPDLDDAERREMDTALADLRLNYVRRAG